MKNCFIILGLDPSVSNENIVLNSIQKKQALWSSQRNHPNNKIKRDAQQWLAEIDNIKKIMLDHDKRVEEAKKAKVIIKKLQGEKRKEFEDSVLLLSKGNVTDQAIKNLALKFKDSFFTEKDIRDELLRLHKSTNNKRNKEVNKNTLDITTSRAIRENLDLLRIDTLYHFLEVNKNVSLSNIQKRINEIDRKLKISKTNTEIDIKRTLVSYCSSIFKNDIEREKYDETLKIEKINPFIEVIDRCCDTGSIEIGQMLILIKKAHDYSLSNDDALCIIKDKAAQRKVNINISQIISFDKGITCYCNYKNKLLSEFCDKCGEALYCKCTKCGYAIAIDSLVCSCGYSLESIYKQLLRSYDIGNKDDFIKQWDDNKFRNHPRFQELVRYYDRIKFIKEENEQQRKILNEKILQLKKAISENNDSAIRHYWDCETMVNLNLIKPFLKRIKDAHRPQDVKNVKINDYQYYIQVKWQPLDDINNYIVAWSHNNIPKDPYKENFKNITRGEYERLGFRIENPTKSNYFVKIYSVQHFNGEVFISPGDSPYCCDKILNRNKTIIEYSIKFSGFPKKNVCHLIIHCSKNVNHLPEMVLIMRKGKVLPSDIDGGSKVYKLKDCGLKANIEQIYKFRIKNISSPSIYRLFLSRSVDSKYFLLMPKNIKQFRR
jgi:hypothetical protein